MSTAHHDKLDGIEASADVTDATNVTAAGALMDSELAGIAAVKATTGTFLTADQTKLDGIAASANNYTLPSASATTVGGVELATTGETTTGTDTARAVTPAGVQAAIDALIGGAPGALDTLNELAAAIGDDASYASTITTALGLKATLASPTFTGTIAIPNVANLETAVVANTAKVTNVSTNLATTTSTTTAIITSSDGTDATIPVATTSVGGVMSKAIFDQHTANVAKNTNVSTALSTGTVDATSYGITSDGGSDDIVLAQATTSVAGVLSAAKWDEIVANTAKSTNVVTNLTATANGTSLTVNSSDGDNVSLPAATTSAWGVMSDDQATKLDGIEASADVTDATNVTAAGALMDSELAGIAAIKATTGTFLSADESKLDGIEASADVTDATNVTAAGALMDSEVTNLAFVKALAKGISDGNVLTANDVVADDDFLRINGTEVEGLTVAEVLTALNVEAAADVTDTANVVAALTAGTNVTISAGGTIASTDTNTQLSEEQVEDFVGGMLGGTETLITVTYQDATGDIDFVVDNDLSNYDNSSSGFITAALTEEQVEDFVGGMLGGTETGITVTYQDATHDIDFVVADTTVAGDSGSTAMTPGDTLTIAGGTNVTTAMSGDTLTITSTDTNTTYAKADFDLDHLFTLVGAAADTSENLGTFTGSTISDSVTIKAALQALETAVETKGVTAGSSSIVTVGTIGTGTWQGTAIATAYIADDAITGAKIALFDDSLAATTTHFLIADGTDYSSFVLSGDVTCTNAGVVSIADDVVSSAELADACTAVTSFTAPLIEGSTSVQTPLIEYTDGDDAITIHDGGSISMAQAVFHPLANAEAEPEDATVTIHLNKANYFDIELGANVTNINLLYGKVGQRFMIRFEQDASANYSIAWNAVTNDFDGGGSAVTSDISWPGGTAPTMTATNDKADTYGFVIRAEGEMDGFVIGQNMPVLDN
jgi:hypothetical protein